MEKKNIKIGFICVHNSCRSQMAEAIAKSKGFAGYEFYSAGTEKKDKINEDAVEIIKELYGIDMEVDQTPKLLNDVPDLDVVVTMGCNVKCPYLASNHREDWGIDDPTALGKEEFVKTVDIIEEKLNNLITRIDNKTITIKREEVE